ncbi:kinase-like domain-containing protein [Mycena olivaceomarginata]|nr:kinase-like domain-containing protein [Mycena olivaceomarginata]
MLRGIFQFKSLKQDIQTVPKEEAFSVLNLTHNILDRGLPENGVTEDAKLLKRRALRLLAILADFLNILPEELAVPGVVLLSDHPVKYGGFADIYHAKCTNSDGEDVEVALKVLKIFQDKSDDGRRLVLQKFAKEALVWRYLKHPNIVPFLGVDGTTFPSPTMAMVSFWMCEGSVLNYMAANSPVFQYAISVLEDVIQGLQYLHSENIVHGDLCGRNILINERRAFLTDFGLAAFIEVDTSVKTSARAGSTRWMAPELLHPTVYHPGLPFRRTPASDVWAFGCVCCEIWTEGEVPFTHMSDGGIIMALSDLYNGTIPYKTKPRDKGDNPLPDGMWELVQECFKRETSERPPVVVLAAMLSQMKHSALSHTGSPAALPRESRTAAEEILNPDPSSPTADNGEHPTPSSVPYQKGKQSVHFQTKYATVRFGPLNLQGDTQGLLFREILDGLFKVVRRDVLTRPVMVEKQDTQYLALRFGSPIEANNFAMTWMVHRYDPYKEVSAVLVDM